MHSGFCRVLASEMAPMMDHARATVLGKYENCLRPQVGEVASEIIDTMKIYLDLFMPTA